MEITHRSHVAQQNFRPSRPAHILANHLDMAHSRTSKHGIYNHINIYEKPTFSANTNVFTYILAPLGLHNVRAARLVQLSKVFLHQPPQAHILHKSRAKSRNGAPYPGTAVSHLPGCGKYALDSYRIFCMDGGEWKSVLPDDKELKKYLKWRWAMQEFKQWNHLDGVVGDINRAYLERLPLELT